MYGYPIEAAAAIAVHECRAFLSAQPDFERITFALFDAAALAIYRELLKAG